MSAMQNQTNRNKSDFRLTRIWARNFKSIRSLDLELGPLTVLVGPNASGKSNVLDVLRFIKDAFDRDLESAVTSRHGIDAVRMTNPQRGHRNVEVGFEVTKDEFEMRYGFEISSQEGVYRVEREHGTLVTAADNSKPVKFEIKDGIPVTPKGFHDDLFNDVKFSTSELSIAFWTLFLFRPAERNHSSDEATKFVKSMRFYRLFPDAIREPRRLMNPHLLAEDGQNLASVLREMVKLDSPYLDEIKTSMAQVVPGLNDLRVDQSGGYLVVKLLRGSSDNGGPGSWFDLSQESDGTVRLLGLLTAFYQDVPNSLIGVEEPELTIHPGALAVLADVMVEASSRTQVVATTHSPDLIDRLPIESLRVVEMRDGCTEVGPVSQAQSKAVVNGLFTSGELHSMEGLVPRS
ncbi:MAG: AAA family ATPase [Chloroflexi bacterium]|nr:AAA family ATPase [Chloroflexota bacterium]